MQCYREAGQGRFVDPNFSYGSLRRAGHMPGVAQRRAYARRVGVTHMKSLDQQNALVLPLDSTAFLFYSQDANYRRAVELAGFVESALMKNTLPPPHNHGSALAPRGGRAI